MSSRACVFSAGCLALILTAGCGGDPPDKEIHQAEGALAAAQAADAEKYAAEEFGAAQTALTNAREAVNQRDYRLALDRALDSRERAQNAAREAADAKAVARGDADRALAATQRELDSADAKLKGAEAGKVPAQFLAEPQKAIDTARVALQEARSMFEKADYREAEARAKAVSTALAVTTGEIDAAIASSAPRRRR